MKKKQLITMLIMVVLVAALALGYFFSKKANEEKEKLEQEQEENQQAEVIDIYDINTEDIVSISITNDKGSIEIINKDELWYQKDTDIPLVDEDISFMLDAVQNFDAIRVINENADNLAEFGLDNPSLKYTIQMKDDTVYDIRFGSKLQTDIEGYYALLDEQNKVYSVSANYYDPFYVSLEEITTIEDEINVNTDNVTKFAVKTSEGLDFAASPVDEDFEGSDYYKWKIDKPYAGVLVDTDALTERISNIPRLSYEKCVAYNCDDMTKYGLDKPYAVVSVESFDSEGEVTETPVPESMRNYSTYILNIGTKYTEDDMEWYYVNPDGSTNVYSMSATFLDELIGFTSFKVTDVCIYTILADQLSGYDIEYEGKKISVERKKENDKDVYYVNGKEVETEALLRLYSAAYLLTYTGEADMEKATPEKDPVLTISYYRSSGKTDVIKYIPYDGNNFYQVDNNGMNYFLTNKRGIDDLIRRYEEYMETVL